MGLGRLPVGGGRSVANRVAYHSAAVLGLASSAVGIGSGFVTDGVGCVWSGRASIVAVLVCVGVRRHVCRCRRCCTGGYVDSWRVSGGVGCFFARSVRLSDCAARNG